MADALFSLKSTSFISLHWFTGLSFHKGNHGKPLRNHGKPLRSQGRAYHVRVSQLVYFEAPAGCALEAVAAFQLAYQGYPWNPAKGYEKLVMKPG